MWLGLLEIIDAFTFRLRYVRKIEASRANMKFWGQSLSQGHYQPTYQQARKGLFYIYFLTLRVAMEFSYCGKTLVKSQYWSDGDASYFFYALFSFWLERKRVGLRNENLETRLFFPHGKINFNYERQNVQSLDDSVFMWARLEIFFPSNGCFILQLVKTMY